MNEQESAQSRLNAFDAAVRNYVRPLPEKFQTLLPYRDGIAELRGKQASFRSITQLLKQVGVTVSHDTLARFCHAVIEPKEVRRKIHPKRVSAASEPPGKQSSASPQTVVSDSDRLHVSALLQQRRNEPSSLTAIKKSRSEKSDRSGPRIADPKNV